MFKNRIFSLCIILFLFFDIANYNKILCTLIIFELLVFLCLLILYLIIGIESYFIVVLLIKEHLSLLLISKLNCSLFRLVFLFLFIFIFIFLSPFTLIFLSLLFSFIKLSQLFLLIYSQLLISSFHLENLHTQE